MGFVPGREARDNTNKVFNLIHLAQKRSIPACDAEKAFDRVNWQFLKSTLKQIGLGPLLTEKILALYQTPSARVRVNGIRSSPLNITNGTRQGCPFSPLLYVLVMEHLAIALRNHDSIRSISLGDEQYKISLFADDLLLHTSSPPYLIACHYERVREIWPLV